MGLSLRNGDISTIGVVPLLLIDSDDPLEMVVAVERLGPTYLTLELWAKRGDNGEFVLLVLLELV